MFSEEEFESLGIKVHFVQQNQSFSRRGVLRGMHYQNDPYEQGKLVRCVSGSIYDVAIDISKNSLTYGKYVSEMPDKPAKMMWIPPGFAHGFLALEDPVAEYVETKPYRKEYEAGVVWNDPHIEIKWPSEPECISEKDRMWPGLKVQ